MTAEPVASGAPHDAVTVQRCDLPHPESEFLLNQVRPDWYWTWKLLSIGFATAEVVQIRQISSAELDSHLKTAAEHSLTIPKSGTGTPIR